MGQRLGSDRLHDSGIAEEDALRARFYAWLAHVLGAPPSAETLDAFGALEGDETDMGQALGTLAIIAAKTTIEAAREEFDALFVGMGQGGELFPYKSYYLTGFLYEKPLAELRGEMARLGIENSGEVREPEDHIAAICEMMHGLITGTFGESADLETQRKFFSGQIATWAPRFFEDLEVAKSSLLYVPVGTVGRVFMEIESEAFAMAA